MSREALCKMTTTYLPEVVKLHHHLRQEKMLSKHNETLETWIENRGRNIFKHNQQLVDICMIPIRNEFFSCPKMFAVCFKDKKWYEKLLNSLRKTVPEYKTICTISGKCIENFTRLDIERFGCFFAKCKPTYCVDKPIVLPPQYDLGNQMVIIKWFFEAKEKTIMEFSSKLSNTSNPMDMLYIMQNTTKVLTECINYVMGKKYSHPLSTVHDEKHINMKSFSNAVKVLRNEIFSNHKWSTSETETHTKTYVKNEISRHLVEWKRTIKKKYQEFCMFSTSSNIQITKKSRYEFFLRSLVKHFDNDRFNHTDYILRGLLGIEKDESYGLKKHNVNDYLPGFAKDGKKHSHMDLFALMGSDGDDKRKGYGYERKDYSKKYLNKQMKVGVWAEKQRNKFKAIDCILSNESQSKLFYNLLGMTQRKDGCKKCAYKLFIPSNKIMKGLGDKNHLLTDYLNVASKMASRDENEVKIRGLFVSRQATPFEDVCHSMEVKGNSVNGVEASKVLKIPDGIGQLLVLDKHISLNCCNKGSRSKMEDKGFSSKTTKIDANLTGTILRDSQRIRTFYNVMLKLGVIDAIESFKNFYMYAPINLAINRRAEDFTNEERKDLYRRHVFSDPLRGLNESDIIAIYAFNNAKLFIMNRVLEKRV